MTQSRIGLLIEPLDLLFFRDGRPFEAGATSRATGGLPLPQTLAGALRTHLWRQLAKDGTRDLTELSSTMERHGGDAAAAAEDALGVPPWAAGLRIAGPWLYLREVEKFIDSPQPPGPLVPVPADIVHDKSAEGSETLIRLRPLDEATSLPGWKGAPGAENFRPLWIRKRGQFERVSGYLTSEGIRTYLDGGDPAADFVLRPEQLFDYEDRTGIKVDPATSRAEDHLLYSVRFLRLRAGTCFYAEAGFGDAGPPDAATRLAGLIHWGGEGRHAQVTVLDRPFGWPVPSNTGQRDLALLVTPGLFGAGQGESPWRPDTEGLPPLLAAAVPGSLPVSGWDLARRRPKPTRFAVPAGSVFFFSQGLPAASSDQPFVELGRPEPETTGLGYGLALRGVWNHAH